jgi:hypothetical protein
MTVRTATPRGRAHASTATPTPPLSSLCPAPLAWLRGSLPRSSFVLPFPSLSSRRGMRRRLPWLAWTGTWVRARQPWVCPVSTPPVRCAAAGLGLLPPRATSLLVAPTAKQADADAPSLSSSDAAGASTSALSSALTPDTMAQGLAHRRPLHLRLLALPSHPGFPLSLAACGAPRGPRAGLARCFSGRPGPKKGL